MQGFWQMWSGVLPDETVNHIIEVAESYPLNEATVGNNPSQTKNLPDVRRSKVSWLNVLDEKTQRINNLCFIYFCHANRNCFGFSIDKIYDIQYTEYDSKNKGHYEEHMDCFMGHGEMSHRKLSMTIQLSDSNDYEGGDFIFNEKQVDKVPLPKDLRKKGTILVFPSFVLHGVKPVTKGKRKSLVSWIEGPIWR